MKTRDYILTNATELFNREGFTSSSLRQVAAYLDMSDGNLRYHFRNKESLLLEIFSEMMQVVEGSFKSETRPGPIQEDLRKHLQLIFYVMYQYRFLFIESTLLLKDYEAIKGAFKQLFEARKQYFMKFLNEGKNRGVLNPDLDDAHYALLSEQIFIISDNWIKYLDLGPTGTLDQKINHYIELCLLVLKPIARPET